MEDDEAERPTLRDSICCNSPPKCPVANALPKRDKSPARKSEIHKQVCATLSTLENRMIVPVMVNGVTISALVDSGATSSFISKSAADDLNIEYLSSTKEIYGFGDKNKINIVGSLELHGKVSCYSAASRVQV